MRVAVLGSTGMAGFVVAQYLQENGHEVYRTSRSETDTLYSAGIDVTDWEALGRWLDQVEPQIIVNCVGLLQRECEARPDLAVLINAYLPHWLEQRYENSAVKIIHLSTDCVFSGAKGGYVEAAPYDGQTIYDRTKALGELRNEKDLTLRMSILGPDTNPHGTGLFNWFMAQRGDMQGYRKAIWNGVTTIELARGIEAAIRQDLRGLYHLVQADPIDKCSLLELFQERFPVEGRTIRPVDGVVLDKSLINTRTDFDFVVRDYPTQLKDMRQWIESHRSAYPHYLFS